jgi:cysteine desulfurase/selenocysteine lyase
MDRYGIPGTVRASLGLYNTEEDIEVFATALEKVAAEAGGRARAPASVVSVARIAGYPPAAAASPEEAAQEVIDAFDVLDDWADRYQYIIELGEKLPPMPAELQTPENRVHGCQSTVFLNARRKPKTEDVVEFLASSDAEIVRGELALLQRVYSGQRAHEVLGFNVREFFARLGLDKHLTLGRRNGLAEMVKRIRSFAADLTQATS